jgi:hypothetical protein
MPSGKLGRRTLLGRDEDMAVFPESFGWLEETLDTMITLLGHLLIGLRTDKITHDLAVALENGLGSYA